MRSIRHIKNFVYGFVLGIAVIIPAFSAGTMAVLLNIFDKILLALDLKNFKRNLPFLALLGLGALGGVFLFSKFMSGLLDAYEMYINYCFIGMIIGCIPMIYKRAKYEKIKKRNISVFFVTLFFMIIIAVTGGQGDSNLTLEQLGSVTPAVCLWLFFAGAAGAVLAILPGISGTIILVIFGAYTVMLESVASFYFPVLAPLAAGMLTGCIAGIINLKKMLNSHPQALYCGILGLIIGSVFTIYPGFEKGINGALSILLMAAFVIITYLFSKKA